MAFPLPHPYIDDGRPDSPYSRIQQNLDALALAVGEGTARSAGASMSQPARVLGTNYQPNALRSTVVHYVFSGVTGAITGVNTAIGSTNPAATNLGRSQTDGTGTDGGWMTGTFIVPPGWWYRIGIENGSPGNFKVTEWPL